MKKQKPMLRIVAFCLVFLVFVYLLTWLAKPDSRDMEHIAGLYGEARDSTDVVYIGGSASFVYFAPLRAWEQFGIVTLDYGANSMQAELYPLLIKELRKTQSPELIVLDARTFGYRDPDSPDAMPPAEISYRATLDGLRLSSEKIRFISRYVEGIGKAKLPYYLDLIKYHTNIVNCKAQNLEMMLGIFRDPYRGFHLVPKYQAVETGNYRTEERRPLSAETDGILDEILDLLDDWGVQCLFVVSPFAEESSHKAIYNYIQDRVEQRGYQFLDANDYRDEMGLDDSRDYYNVGHVNVFGAEKFTDFLSEYLIAQYRIPIRREDPKYAFMDEYLPAWNEKLSETKAEILSLMEKKQ